VRDVASVGRGCTPGFVAEQIFKDLKLSQKAAQSAPAQTRTGARAAGLYDAFVKGEGMRRDLSAMIEYLKGGSHGRCWWKPMDGRACSHPGPSISDFRFRRV
jgi:hypothetical protein